MLFLLFQIGEDRYAIEAGQIVEVLPMLNVKVIPRAAEGIKGVINYHGVPVPVVDLRQLAMGMPSRQQLTTRIVLVNHIVEGGGQHLLGLLAEGVTGTIRRNESGFTDPGVKSDQAPYLGQVTTDSEGIVQRVEIANLLPTNVLGQIFQEQTRPA
ncbi:MAG TPA: chemotaxis protein CheW [Blastocatellia bacterium]|nr:chemotaxis protein CheW [Blastocatellia bacterium]